MTSRQVPVRDPSRPAAGMNVASRSMGIPTLVLSAALAMACSPAPDFGRALEESVGRSAGSTVTFRELTTFQWDAVHVYGPYHPLKEIRARHGVEIETGRYDGNSVPEGKCLYLFTQNGRAVEVALGPRYCARLKQQRTFSAADVVFRVTGSGPHWELEK